jgi:predicted Zn-dependent protease
MLECAAMNEIPANTERTQKESGHSLFSRVLRRPGRLLAIGALVALIGLGGAVAVMYVQAFLHLRSGRMDLQRHHNAEALAHLQSCLRIWPKDPEILLLSARASWRLQQFEEARRYLQRFQKAGGSREEFNRETILVAAAGGEVERATSYFQDQQQRPEWAIPLILEALVSGCLRQERIGEATRFLQEWLKLQPDDTQALLFQANLDGFWKAPQDAIAEYRRILQLDSELDLAKLPLAALLVETRQYLEAIPLLESLEQRQPKNIQALLLLARCRDFLGQQEAAEQLLARVLAQTPDHVAALTARAQLALHTGQLTAAETWLRRALAREPGNYQVGYLLTECLMQQGRMEEMRNQLQRLKQQEADQKRIVFLRQEIGHKPHEPSLPRELAMLLLRNGDAEAGLHCLLNALRENPTSEPLKQALTEYYQQIGNRERPGSRPPMMLPQAAADAQKQR